MPRTKKPKTPSSSSSSSPVNRDNWTQAQWAQALSNAGDFRKRTFSLGPNPAVKFINALTHTGDFSGVPFCLRAWQEAIVRSIFLSNGKCRYRKVFLGFPRKNGKTELLAAILLFLILGTGKLSQRIFSASGDREQAALIYGAAAEMVRNNPILENRCLTYDGYKRICFEPLGSIYQALSSDAPRKHGLRPSAVLLDELHVFPNRNLYVALMSAFGATLEPLTLMITTAGWDRTSLCWEQWQYAQAVQNGEIDDPGFFSVIFSAPQDADWTSEDTWFRAMPALGDFCQVDFIREECRQAQKLPAYENTFRQLYLNQWTEQAQRWISVDAWNACGGYFPPAELAGEPCYAGLDLGVTGDMSCYWMIFPTSRGIYTIGHGWVPEDGKWKKELRNKDRYEDWHRKGYLTFTPGNTTDHNRIEADVVRWADKYPLRLLFGDRAYATQLLTRFLNEHNLPVKGIPQGPITLNEACVRLEELILGGELHHGSNPILDWNLANATVQRTSTGLIYPDKSSATERIDGLAALVNAIAAMVSDPDIHGPSVYDTPGNLSL